MAIQRKINVEDARLKTAFIEIKAISINNKQMTLSVFRQVPEEDIIDLNTVQLKGVPWGKVNYFWGNINPKNKVNLLWQKDNELRRCIIDSNFFRKSKSEYEDLLKWGVRGDYNSLFFKEFLTLPGEIVIIQSWAETKIDPNLKKAIEEGWASFKMFCCHYIPLIDQLEQIEQLFIAV